MTKRSGRSIKNFVINPKFQMRMSFYFMSATMAVMGIMLIFVYFQVSEVSHVVANAPGIGIDTQAQIDGILWNIVRGFLIFIVFVVAAILTFGVVISHRIAGPMYAILLYIAELKKGNYDSQRTLRPYDELTPIMDGLHELAAELKTKKP